jgi:gluconate kinase
MIEEKQIMSRATRQKGHIFCMRLVNTQLTILNKFGHVLKESEKPSLLFTTINM